MAESPTRPGLPPELLERIRRGFPLRLDALGRFLFEEDEITHPGVVDLFRSGIDLNDAGELVLQVGEQWTYLNPSDCPLRVMTVAGTPGEDALPQLQLDDGRVLSLDWTSLVEDEDRGLRCSVPAQGSGRALAARFTNRAALSLSDWLGFDDDERPSLPDGQPVPLVAAD